MPVTILRPACLLAVLAILIPAAGLARAQTSNCLAVAANEWKPRVLPVSLELTAQTADEVAITYVGHSAFRIRSAEGVVIVTDFAGNAGEGPVPDIATMNHAHSSHYTVSPDPAIANVLPGWNPDGDNPVKHRLELKDVYVRNVTTDLYYDGMLLEKDGNSIFIFEIAGLCLGHVGHLHHKLTPEHIAEIGRIDVLFVPVDGTYTMSLAGMIELAGQLRSSIVIPMHYFSTFTLQRFVAGMSEKFETVLAGSDTITVSLKNLPPSPTVTVLSPY